MYILLLNSTDQPTATVPSSDNNSPTVGIWIFLQHGGQTEARRNLSGLTQSREKMNARIKVLGRKKNDAAGYRVSADGDTRRRFLVNCYLGSRALMV